MKKVLALVFSHGFAVAVGFAAGVYFLPILIAPPAPSPEEIGVAAASARYNGEFSRDLEGSDALHWGEGTVYIGHETISLEGRLAPGPDYKLYLAPEFVQTKAEFLRVRPRMVRVGDVRTFTNFVVPVPEHVDPDAYDTVVVWCESFSRFITAARYR